MKFDTLTVEKHIDSGNFYIAKKLIHQYLKNENKSLESRLIIAQFFFQLHDFKSALKYISIKELLESPAIHNKILKEECLIFAARILNVLGAFHFAIHTVKALSIETQKKFALYLAGIYMTNNYFKIAISFYELSITTSTFIENYHSYKPLIARCHTGNSQFLEAEKIANEYLEEIKNDSTVDRQAALHSILGELFLTKNDLEKSLHHLELANMMYEKLPISNNVGYAQMWLAACYGLSGLSEKSDLFFNLSWKSMYKQGLQPKIWLQIFFWKGLIEFKKTGLFNLYWKKIITYPDVTEDISSNFGFVSNFGQESTLVQKIKNYTEIPEILYLTTGNTNLTCLKSNNLNIDYHFETTLDKFNCYHKPLTLNLEIILIQAGPEGIPIYKACEILWPDQAASILSLTKRIEQFVIQINNPIQKIKTENNHLIYIDHSKILKWIKKPIDVSEFFLNQHFEFTRESVEKYFQLSKSKSAQICKKWLDYNLILKINSGKKTKYQKKL